MWCIWSILKRDFKENCRIKELIGNEPYTIQLARIKIQIAPKFKKYGETCTLKKVCFPVQDNPAIYRFHHSENCC